MKPTGVYPSVPIDAAGRGVVSSAGALLLTETVRVSGLGAALSEALAPWRAPTATHDPAKVLTDLAVSLALGGDCLADIGLLRVEPELSGPVASDPTVSRTVDRLADDVDRVLAGVFRAVAATRERVWALAGAHAPDQTGPVRSAGASRCPATVSGSPPFSRAACCQSRAISSQPSRPACCRPLLPPGVPACGSSRTSSRPKA